MGTCCKVALPAGASMRVGRLRVYVGCHPLLLVCVFFGEGEVVEEFPDEGRLGVCLEPQVGSRHPRIVEGDVLSHSRLRSNSHARPAFAVSPDPCIDHSGSYIEEGSSSSALQYNTLQYNTIQYGMVQRSAFL